LLSACCFKPDTQVPLLLWPSAGVLSCWQDIIAPDAGSSQFCTVQLPQQLQQLTYRELRRYARHACFTATCRPVDRLASNWRGNVHALASLAARSSTINSNFAWQVSSLT
jgi:hypothetical protein